MELYTPVPFLPERFDQTAQRLSLAQMAYEAELARIQSTQQAKMLQGQNIAGLGAILPDFMNRQMELAQIREMQRQRQEQLQIEKAYREGLIRAQEREDKIRQDELDYRRNLEFERNKRAGQEDLFKVGMEVGSLTPAQYGELSGTPFQAAFAPSVSKSLAALSQVPTVLGASSVTPAEEYVSREVLAKQGAETQIRQNRRDAAIAVGADSATADMFALTGQPSVLNNRGGDNAGRVMVFGDRLVNVRPQPGGGVSTTVLMEKPGKPAEPVAVPPVKRIQNTAADDNSKSAVINIASALPESNRNLWVDGWRDLEQKALQNNDWTAAAKYVAAKAIEQMPAAVETRVAGKLEAAKTVSDVMRELNALNQRGLLGAIPNTYEKLQNFVGQTSDPELAKAAARLLTVMQEYRRATTGVAFSPEERKEFDRILPSTNKSLEFNVALFEGMKKSLESALIGNLGLRIGDKYMNALLQDINRSMMPAASPGAAAQSPTGNVRPPGGNPFRKR